MLWLVSAGSTGEFEPDVAWGMARSGIGDASPTHPCNSGPCPLGARASGRVLKS